ncbi:uncharacterized protein LY89DRAFT_691563 [Mollisia scopiformis]|uniref:DUF218 domain-containing protein n=1 Tax=Mollisia scopiformis TaxID=149040 RepID=A0A132B895_MOLSC|nr:uncharacterized protein LY89DRAFT_691563 [Mollisia scopiformis]KUJ07897.1 hypothetical protein LY89DRAFT_691563 [Mollisia scopiformis]
MSFNPSITDVQKYLKADFQPIHEDLFWEAAESKTPEKWQEELQSSIRDRLKDFDPIKQGWKLIVEKACITVSDIRLMLQQYPSEHREQKKQYVVASANKANYLVNVLLGRISTKWYPDVEHPAFDEDDEAYNNFLIQSLHELMNSNPNTAMYNRFFFASKLKCVNDHGRLPKNIELQGKENLPFMEHIQQWNDKYGFILVFGDSPLDWDTKLSKMAIEKANKCLSHNSPQCSTKFITCGTAMRPFGTTIVESFELKQYLLSHGVSEKNILIDTCSEHTNTNIWNAACLAFEAGMPIEKKMIAFMLGEQFAFVAGNKDGGMRQRTKEEVCPDMYDYLTIEKGDIDGSVVVGFKESFKDCPKWRLQWKNHVGKEIEVEDILEEGFEYL